MRNISDLEIKRLEIQSELDSEKTQDERNRLGQFATPTQLASEILSFARTLLPDDTKIRFIDPAFGTGSFYSALLTHFSNHSVSSAIGFEIDSHYGEPAKQIWNDFPLTIHIDDFTKAVPPKSFS